MRPGRMASLRMKSPSPLGVRPRRLPCMDWELCFTFRAFRSAAESESMIASLPRISSCMLPFCSASVCICGDAGRFSNIEWKLVVPPILFLQHELLFVYSTASLMSRNSHVGFCSNILNGTFLASAFCAVSIVKETTFVLRLQTFRRSQNSHSASLISQS